MADARRLGLAVSAALLATVLCAGAFRSSAQAQQPADRESAPHPSVLTADLETIPDGRDFANWYPEDALLHSVSGRTVLRCDINLAGELIGCEVVSEEPQSWGFGAASIGLSKSFRVAKRMADGRLTAGGQIMIPIRWRMEPDQLLPGMGAATAPLGTAVLLIRGRESELVPSAVFWVQTPTNAQRAALVPTTQGMATLHCRIDEDRSLTRCSPFGETHKNAGLSEAALRLAPLYRALEEHNGKPTVGAVAIIHFDFNFAGPVRTPSPQPSTTQAVAPPAP